MGTTIAASVPPPTNDEKGKWFPPTRPEPEQGVFELGLVLGGTVAAGAFTAGALDFLLEALEAYYEAPQHWHELRFELVAGTSGGAMCTAMLGLLSGKKVPHVGPGDLALAASPVPTGNPLWDTWVNRTDGAQFLTNTDIGAGDLTSLLNGGLIDAIGRDLTAFATTTGTYQRPYFPAPFRMAVTLANLRGIPYKLDVPGFEGWSGASYTAHDDFARFAVPNGADKANRRPDEFWIDPMDAAAGGDSVGFDRLVAYATASGAFPVGLPARALRRPARHYAFRPYVQPTPTGGTVEFPQPDWASIPLNQGDYEFVSVDGGTFNNDPVKLVHQALAGMLGSNPRKPETASRALFMIDPLAAKPRSPVNLNTGLQDVLSRLVGCVTEGGRYLTSDMVLIADPTVFSRFQLVPARRDLQLLGEAALATAPFGAFGGFFCRAFRVHDFLLGRLNMQNYLRTTMILRGDNKLFVNWPADARQRFAVNVEGQRIELAGLDAKDYFLPLIPDMSYTGEGPIAVEPDHFSLPWPVDKLDPSDLTDAFNTRIRAVLDKLRQQDIAGIGGWLAGLVVEPALAAALTSKIIDAFRNDLRDAQLLS